jgi:dihydrofolate reductase
MNRPVLLFMQVSLDGYVASPDGSLDWAFARFDDELMTLVAERISEMDTMLMGRVNYLEQAAHWPHAGADDVIAPIVNAHEKVVFSTTLASVEWQNSRLAKGKPAEEIAALQARPGGVIGVSGGPTFAQSLLRDGLVDRIQLAIHPVAIGQGLPLFAELQQLSPIDSHPLRSGIVVNRYTVQNGARG